MINRRGLVVFLLATILIAALAFSDAYPRDQTGQHANSTLKGWFDKLSSGNGLCCSDADGNVVLDADWDTANPMRDGHYRVRIDGEWVDVPDRAVITAPNLFGRTMVWPTWSGGVVSVRCFLPGPGM
jgi:hypothetical protein